MTSGLVLIEAESFVCCGDGSLVPGCCLIVAGGLGILESWEEPANPSASQSVRGGDISASHSREGSGTTIPHGTKPTSHDSHQYQRLASLEANNPATSP